jgi:hypothetical protein
MKDGVAGMTNTGWREPIEWVKPRQLRRVFGRR